MPRRAEPLVSRVQWPSRKHCNRYPGQEGRSLGEPMEPIYRGGRGGEQPPGEPLGDRVRPVYHRQVVRQVLSETGFKATW